MNFKTFFLNGISVFLGIIFFTAGMAKLYFEHKFPGVMGPPWLEERLSEYNLGLFARFIAYSQVIVGFILLTLRYRALGSITLLPIVLSTLVITISLQWRGTPYVLTFFLLLNLILLIAEAPKLLHLVGFRTNYTLPTKATSPAKYGLMWLSGLILALFSISLSNHSLVLAHLFNLAGIAISLNTYIKGGRVGKQQTIK
ncbi:hypothetical protein ACFSKU_17200 [Pontibacter silvestris]|uniref:DoxX family protein n=1 Tax=Pontibacter silvestris TaxID=2305183 RepID=A0ABW4X2T0_9BACT|nr:hypothetical protein [Pontibacter silvestris]MCC9135761.1 hypothetical protein [Pontibacter silvestris]